MALHGTLEDFGIAEILQLIAQQAKSGTLHLRSRDDDVDILFADGNVVSADASRRSRDRLGGLLLRAGLVSREDLARALDAQRRSLRRLGDVLVELRLVTKDDLREVARLQTTETVYRLFSWKKGTYQFEPGEVEWDRDTVTPLRAESVLMEGFRRIDEWPLVRKKVPSAAATVEVLVAELPPPSPQDEDEGGLGRNERRVHALVAPGRTVAEIADLARLGEFDASRALATLAGRGLVAVSAAPRRSAAAAARSWRERVGAGLRGAAATLAIAAAVAGLVRLGVGHVAAGTHGRVEEVALGRLAARSQRARLAEALEIYRLERGEYPGALSALVDAGLATRADLRWPWHADYAYQRTAEGYLLLSPLE